MPSDPNKPPRRKPTHTSAFGANGRISHDASAYYGRAMQQAGFGELDVKPRPESPLPDEARNRIFTHSSEQMPELPDRSVHLMVTSPPYNVGKEYDEDLTLDEYSGLLRRVLAETYRVLVDGGRACVNVANLGRKPYIPLHAIVIEQAAAAGFFMRGEIIWDKGAGAGVSTAWGSWKSPANPTLRDVHEYILVFQKPPFGRKKPAGREATISRDQFLEYTKSVWELGPQSAKQAGHPAPFPVELPERLIQIYTYSDEAVLDPFMGTGATALAAVKSKRVYIGYDLSEDYKNTAIQRIDAFNAGEKFRPSLATGRRNDDSK